MANYSPNSQGQLNTCCSPIRKVFTTLIERDIDHSVLEGHRGEIDQNAYADADPPKSQIRWPYGKHNSIPSNAVDAVPYVKVPGLKGGIHWHEETIISQGFTEKEAKKIVEMYHRQMVFFAATVVECARSMGIIIRWGGDWDRDWSLMDNRFNDYPHFEFVGYF